MCGFFFSVCITRSKAAAASKPTPTPTPSSLPSATNGRETETVPTTSRSTSTMVITMLRASVEADSTSSSRAVRGSILPAAVVGMMTRELVPPTMAPGHQPRQEGSRCGKTHRGDYPEPEANYGDRTGESPYAKQECSGPGHGHVLQPQSGRAAGQDDDEREGTEQRHCKSAGETSSNTGPARIPAHTSQSTSGIPVREKTNSPTAPSNRMAATISSTWAIDSTSSPDRLGTPGSPFQQSAVLKHRFGSGRFVASLDCGR